MSSSIYRRGSFETRKWKDKDWYGLWMFDDTGGWTLVGVSDTREMAMRAVDEYQKRAAEEKRRG